VNVVALLLLFVLGLAALPLWRDLPPIPRMRVRAGAVITVGAAVLSLAGLLAWAAPGPGAPARHGGTGWSAWSGLGWTSLSWNGLLGPMADLAGVFAAVSAGGPVVLAILRLADQNRPIGQPGPADTTALSGGAWIGGLERIVVAGSLIAGWPEGIALALVIKGFGRYPELRVPAAAERFIIGTFASVLWATASAAVARAVQH
jgi:hypothetical protein